MKNLKTILTILSFVLMYATGFAQGNCPGDKIKVYKGASGCGCHCQKECVTPAELPVYLANGWNTVGCWNCCWFKNWVDAGTPKTSLDEIHTGEEAGVLAIAFTLASARQVKIQVTDLIGQYVTTVIDEHRDELENELMWSDNQLSPGVYLLNFEAGDHRETKMISIAD